MATRELLAELAGCSARELSQPVETSAGGGVDILKRVQAGEAADIVVLAASAIDRLIAEGHLLAYSRTDLVKSGVAIAVQKGAPHPDVSSEAAVKQAVRRAHSLGYSTGPSGVYLEKLFARWGILEEIRSRIVVPPPGVPVGSLVATGGCALGFQQLSELADVTASTCWVRCRRRSSCTPSSRPASRHTASTPPRPATCSNTLHHPPWRQ